MDTIIDIEEIQEKQKVLINYLKNDEGNISVDTLVSIIEEQHKLNLVLLENIKWIQNCFVNRIDKHLPDDSGYYFTKNTKSYDLDSPPVRIRHNENDDHCL